MAGMMFGVSPMSLHPITFCGGIERPVRYVAIYLLLRTEGFLEVNKVAIYQR
jgi:hypothetical protein